MARTHAGARQPLPHARRGLALYHESNYRTGRWHFTLGVRLDCEHVRLHTTTAAPHRATAPCGAPDDARSAAPKRRSAALSASRSPRCCPRPRQVLSELGRGSDLYASVSEGIQGRGIQHPDVLRHPATGADGAHGAPGGAAYDIDRVATHRPEKSWNRYELGKAMSPRQRAPRGDFALFRIDCRDQQLTVFPDGTTTGRMMTNAGRTRSPAAKRPSRPGYGGASIFTLAYGYTRAVFRRYDDGRCDYRGKRIPYAPEHTARHTWRGASPPASGGWATWCWRPAPAAWGRSAGTSRTPSRSPSTCCSTPRCGLEHPHYTPRPAGRQPLRHAL